MHASVMGRYRRYRRWGIVQSVESWEIGLAVWGAGARDIDGLGSGGMGCWRFGERGTARRAAFNQPPRFALGPQTPPLLELLLSLPTHCTCFARDRCRERKEGDHDEEEDDNVG